MQTMITASSPSDACDDSSDDRHPLQVKIPKQLHAKAKAKARERQVSLTLIISTMLNQWVEGKIEVKIAA